MRGREGRREGGGGEDRREEEAREEGKVTGREGGIFSNVYSNIFNIFTQWFSKCGLSILGGLHDTSQEGLPFSTLVIHVRLDFSHTLWPAQHITTN